LELLFLEQAKAEGLIQLKGHGGNKGIRASCYNAMPVVGI
jgi:phosphoserine aminotransferase